MKEMMQKQGNNCVIVQQLKQINENNIDDKLKMTERIKSLEKELSDFKDDYQQLLSRVESTERENFQLRTKSD